MQPRTRPPEAQEEEVMKERTQGDQGRREAGDPDPPAAVLGHLLQGPQGMRPGARGASPKMPKDRRVSCLGPDVGPKPRNFAPEVRIVVFGHKHRAVDWEQDLGNTNPRRELPDLGGYRLTLDKATHLDAIPIGDPDTTDLAKHDGRHPKIRLGCRRRSTGGCARSALVSQGPQRRTL